MKTVIATIALGDECRQMWETTFAPSVHDYADRHGYGVRCFTEPLDGAKPAPWQRLLLAGHPELQSYDRIVYLDSDIMCNPSAPGIAEAVPDHKIGAVTWKGSYHNDPVWYDMFRRSWTHNNQQQICDANIKSFSDLAVYGGYPPNEDWLNSGVLVFGPEHAEFLSNIYWTEPHTETSANEQQALTHYLCNLHADSLHPLDRRFNTIWYFMRAMHYPFISQLDPQSLITSKCVETTLMHSYFLHFAADGDRSEAVNFMRMQHLIREVA